MNIICALNKRKRNIVKIPRRAPFNIRQIFWRQDITAKIGIRQIQALIIHHEAIILGHNLNRGVRNNFDNMSMHLTIKHKNWFTNLYLIGKIILQRQNSLFLLLFNARIQNNFVAFFNIIMIVFD